ncbi:MAG: metallophosphoesterase family protein [Bacteroidota bacterium]
MKRFVISDIHGCLNTFKTLLDRLQFSTSDELYLLGDYVHRGPDSLGVVTYIMELQENYNVVALRGNHEQMEIDAIAYENLTGHSNQIAYLDFNTKQQEWLFNLPFYHEVDDYILVHAGLNFEKQDPFTDTEELIWIRDWYNEIDYEWLKDRIIIHGHTPVPQVFIQHQFKKIQKNQILNIDAGCVFKNHSGLGHLCALDLTNMRLFFHPYEEHRFIS